jgi:CHAT domain-containing protein
LCLAGIFLAACAALAQDATPLDAGRWVAGEISGHQTQEFAIGMKAGEFAGILLRHRGIDFSARLIGPDGGEVFELVVPELSGDEESQGFVAQSTGIYRLRVKAPYQGTTGRYEVRLNEVRAATDRDRRLHESSTLATEAHRLSNMNEYRDALPLAMRSVEIAEAELGPQATAVAFRLQQAGELYFHAGAYDKAESALGRALEIDDRAFGRDHPRCIAVLAALAETYREAGEYPKAEPLLTRGLEVGERVLGPEHPALIFPLIVSANLHQARGDWARGEEELQRAISIAKRSLDFDSLRALEAMNNLAVLYNSRGEYAKAEPLLNHVVEAEQRVLPADSPVLAIPLWNLALIANDWRKEPRRALELYGRALALLEKSVGPEQPQVLSVLNNIANIYKSTGDFDRALELHFRVHATSEKVLGPYHNLTLISLGNIARTYASMRDVENSLKFQTLTDEAIEKNLALNLAAGSERQKLAYFDSLSERTDRTISLQVGLAPESQAAARLAALAVLRRKGRVLDAMSLTLASLRQRMDPQSQALLDTWNASTSQYARLALGGPGVLSAAAYRKRLAEFAERRDRAEAAVSGRSAEFIAHSQPVTLDAVESVIPPRTVLIEFSTWRPFDPRRSNNEAYGERRYIAYVLSSDSAVKWKDLGPAGEIDLAADKFRHLLRDPGQKDVPEAARALDHRIMEPLRALSGDARQLLISPDGLLNLVPFQALIDEHGEYLVERYSITYLSSGRDLLRLQAPRSIHGPPVIFADPLFGEPAGTPVAAGSPVAGRRSHTAAELKDLYFAPLPGAGREALAIQSLFPEARLLAGRDATESALKHLDAPSILHIATHGFFLPAQAGGAASNPLLRSGLALAGANRKEGGDEDGIFTALEASGLNLWGTQLVNLSACDTGVGEVKDGEGVYGLRRAFVLAGAETLVMTLWPVGDYVTRQAMTAFYAGLKQGLGRGEALRQAQLQMLKQSGREHPFYWAGFIQSGQWAPLDARR